MRDTQITIDSENNSEKQEISETCCTLYWDNLRFLMKPRIDANYLRLIFYILLSIEVSAGLGYATSRTVAGGVVGGGLGAFGIFAAVNVVPVWQAYRGINLTKLQSDNNGAKVNEQTSLLSTPGT